MGWPNKSCSSVKQQVLRIKDPCTICLRVTPAELQAQTEGAGAVAAPQAWCWSTRSSLVSPKQNWVYVLWHHSIWWATVLCSEVTQKAQTSSELSYQRYHMGTAFTECSMSAFRLAPLGLCYTETKAFMDLQAKHRLLTQKQQKPWKLTTKAYLMCEHCWKRKASEGMFSLAAKKHIS